MCVFTQRSFVSAPRPAALLGARCPPPAPRVQPAAASLSPLDAVRLSWIPQMPQLYLMPEVLAGLMAGGILVLAVFIGVNCLMNIQSPRTFPKEMEKKAM